MPTKNDAARFSGEVAERLSDHHEDIGVIAPSSEFQGTNQGYWTVRGAHFDVHPVVDFAIWPVSSWSESPDQGYHLRAHLLGNGRVRPMGHGSGPSHLTSTHNGPDTAFHRLMGILRAQAAVLEAGGRWVRSSDQGADAVSDNWIN
jgi:hypothetical protein